MVTQTHHFRVLQTNSTRFIKQISTINSMIFKTMDNELKVFGKTILTTTEHLKNLETVNATVYNKNGQFNLQGLSINTSQSVSNFTKLNNAFKAYNGNLTKSTQLQNAYIKAVGNQNGALGNYLAGLNGAKASMGGYIKSLIGAKAATIGLQVASTLLNAALSLGLSLALSAIVSGITHLVNKEKEAREQAIENAQTAKEEADNLTELLNKYNQLSEEVKTNTGVKDDLLETQGELLESLGIEQSQLDGLIKKYGDLNTAINKVTLNSLNDAQADLMVAVDAREKELINVGKDYKHWFSPTNRNLISTGGEESKQAYDVLAKAGVISQGSVGTGGGVFTLVGDDKTVDGILENYQKLKEAQTALNEAVSNGEISKEDMGSNPLYKAINSRLDELKTAVDNYNSAIKNVNENSANQEIISNLIGKDLPQTEEEFETFKQSLIDSAQASNNFIGSQEDIKNSIIDALAEMPEFEKYFDDLAQAESDVQHETPISFDPTSLITETDDKSKTATLADLKSEADLMQSLQSEIAKTGNIGVDSMQKIIKQFPEAKQYLADYMSGLITEQELFSKLENVYAEDTQQYINSLVKKNETDADFFTNVKNNNETLFNGLAENYGFDIKNWNNLAKAKLDVDKQLMAELASIWTGYYTAQKDSVTGLYTLVTNPEFDVQDDSDLVTPEMEESRVKQMAIYDKYNQIIQSLNDAAGSFAKANIDLDWNVLGKDDSSSSSSSSKDTKEKFNWIEPLIKRISTAYSRLKNVVSDTTSTWLNRNNALSDSMSTLADEINVQSQAYEYYINAFNGYDLDDYYKNQIANGSISIDVIYDEDLKNAISDCQDFYDKAQDAKTAVQELGIELKGLAKSRFDNIKSQFEEQISQITKTNDLLQKEADIIDTKGWFASTLLNNSFIEQEQKNLNKLKEERTALVNALNSAIDSGKIEEYSEDWYDMQSSIDDCTSSILDAEKALIEYDNAIRQINWDAFDRTRDDVEDLINETDFLVELLKDVGITDDNGNMTKEGQAAQALLAQKYQLYLNQAKAYKDEISKINEDLANDPYDKELLDRKQDLIDKEQEAIKSAMSEKDAIKDLTNDAYTDFIDKLGDVIDKYKELMDTMKDAYDYEKSIREKTEALNALEKQYSAYQGDNSEEGKKNIQQLKDQINTAKDDLKDTEYEKLINDTEKILDQLQSDTQEWINQRLDDLDNLIQDIIEQSNENASDISQTITSTAENYGYKLSESMASIWSTNTNNINKVLGDFGTSFIDSNNKIKDVCNDINAAVQGLLKNSNDEAQRMAEEIARQQQEQNSNNNNDYGNGGNNYDNSWENNWDSGSNDYDGGGSSGGVDWIYDPDDFNKDDLNIDTSIVDRLKWHDFASDFAARSQYYDQMGGDGEYYATYDQNVWMLDWMKSHGYRNGTKSATAGIHRTDEDGLGSEVIFSKKYGTLRKLDAGDMVFNADQVEKLWNLSKGITTPNMYMDNLGAKLPDIPNISNNLSNKVDVEFGDVTLSLPNVHNYEDFMKQMVSDKRFLKAVQEGTFGQVLGRNSLNMLTFR